MSEYDGTQSIPVMEEMEGEVDGAHYDAIAWAVDYLNDESVRRNPGWFKMAAEVLEDFSSFIHKIWLEENRS